MVDKEKLILVAVIEAILAVSLIVFVANMDKQKDHIENSSRPQSKAEAYRSVFGK
jgi:competence protein ComGC